MVGLMCLWHLVDCCNEVRMYIKVIYVSEHFFYFNVKFMNNFFCWYEVGIKGYFETEHYSFLGLKLSIQRVNLYFYR